MDSSTLALIFFVSLIVFFVLLVICTIAYFVSKSKNKQDVDDEYSDEDETQNEKVKKVKKDNQPKPENKVLKEQVIDKKSDKEQNDGTPVDSAFTDSAFTDSAFVDSAFADSAFADSAFADSAFADSLTNNQEASDKQTNDFIQTVKLDNNTSDSKTLNENKVQYENNDLDDYDEDEDPITDELITPGLVVNKTTNEKTDTDDTNVAGVVVENIVTENTVTEDIATANVTTEAQVDDNTSTEQNVPTSNEELADSAFSEAEHKEEITNELIEESVREAEAMVANVMGTDVPAQTMFDISNAMSQFGKKKTQKAVNNVLSSDDFYWYNKMDVAQKPAYKTAEMYYHHFDRASECIEDLLIEMYDCALVRTEEIKYIAYGIEPKTISMKEIMAIERQGRKASHLKEPTAQDLVRIYEKWCSYVDKLFDKVEIHADDATIEEIRKLLCEFGRNDVDVLIEGK